MNSSSTAGTHHIFFPPRLEAMACERHAYGFAADSLCDAALDHLLRNQAHAPACTAGGWRTADHRSNRRLLRAVELPLRVRPRLITECGFEPGREIALGHSGDL